MSEETYYIILIATVTCFYVGVGPVKVWRLLEKQMTTTDVARTNSKILINAK